MNFRKGQRRDDPEINLIAFIDVLLVILIFLMVTTTYSKFTALQITLPEANAEQPVVPPRVLSVAVDAEGRYAINAHVVGALSPEALAGEIQRVAAGHLDTVVEIHADARSSHQSVVNVLEAARLAGMVSLRFSAQARRKP